MANIDNILKGIEKDIEDILFAYVKTESFTNTINEKKAEEFFLDYFSKIPYFKNTPGSYGIYEIENDALNRNVSYAFLKGRGQDTIVFIHHNDINIGPWGKDFHKMTERVNKEDLYVRTPMIINKAISLILGN